MQGFNDAIVVRKSIVRFPDPLADLKSDGDPV